VKNSNRRRGCEDEQEKSMLSILLVGRDPVSFAVFAGELSKKEGVKVSRAGSGKEAWDTLDRCNVDVVVVDKKPADEDALSFVQKLIKRKPLINCAMVSTLSPEDFLEVTEGLGIFMQLPADPGPEDAVKMMQLLESIDALMGM
jgi:CheY-like chemotaxis protein